MFAIWWLMGTKVHGNTMLDDAIALKNLIENMQRSPTIDHVVLGDDLEPIHNRLFGENVLVMRHAKTYPNSEVCESIERICWHVSIFLKETAGREFNPDPLGLRCLLVLVLLGCISGHFGPVRCTATLALAGVLSLATIVTGLAATLALAGVLALTSVLFRFVFLVLLVRAAIILHAHRSDASVVLA
jgi:hypothetical protein